MLSSQPDSAEDVWVDDKNCSRGSESALYFDTHAEKKKTKKTSSPLPITLGWKMFTLR